VVELPANGEDAAMARAAHNEPDNALPARIALPPISTSHQVGHQRA